MKTEQFDMETRVRETYESPKCRIIALQSEGVLCNSFPGSGTDDFGEDDYSGGNIWE